MSSSGDTSELGGSAWSCPRKEFSERVDARGLVGASESESLWPPPEESEGTCQAGLGAEPGCCTYFES